MSNRVFAKMALSAGHVVSKGETGQILHEIDGFVWVKFDSGTQKIVRKEWLEAVPFTPGLYRRVVEPAGYGYETRWFDREPSVEWVRI